MGTNGNQYDMELFFIFFSTLEALEIKLNAGEEESFVIPYTMNEAVYGAAVLSAEDKVVL